MANSRKHRRATPSLAYRIVGYDEGTHVCEACGRRGLDGTIVLEDRRSEERVHLGSDCAANAIGARDPQALVETAKRLARREREAEPAPTEDTLAEAVLDAAERAPGWPPGESREWADRAFVVDVWEELRRTGYPGTLEAFKRALDGLRERGLVRMSRADLREAMDGEKVAASEMRHHGAVLHFIRRRGA